MNKKYVLPLLATLLPAISVLSSWALLQNDSHFTAVSHREQEGGPTFKEFLAEFPAGRLPYELSAETLKQQLLNAVKNPGLSVEGKRLSPRYIFILPALDRSRFARSPEFIEPMMAFSVRQGHAVVYKLLRSHAGSRYTNYGITTYDPEGKILNEQTFAAFNPERITSGVIQNDLVLTNVNYRLTWEKSTEDGLPDDNTIVEMNKEGESTVDMKEEMEGLEKPRPKKKQTRPEPALLESETTVNG